GVDTLIHAMSRLRLEDLARPVHLAIIGGEPDALPEDMTEEMARLQRLCDDLCMERMVVFLGKRGQDTLPYYYSAAEMLVMPSLYESFGMVALEAMACGAPVIASEVGGLGYLVQDGITGYTIPDSDPEALREKMARLLSDPRLRETMGAEAAKYALNYAWEKIAARVVEVYRELARR
ncbi:MAG: glycosyltransferase family 4 protein, partial [Chloroflexi bacterium]|nr:glycosyltransferase family 4 protein [Chloroflexota bacterium]